MYMYVCIYIYMRNNQDTHEQVVMLSAQRDDGHLRRFGQDGLSRSRTAASMKIPRRHLSLSLSLSFSLSLSVSISFSEPLKSLKRAATEPQDFKRDLREPQYSSKEPQKSLKRAFKEPQKSLSRASKEPQKSLKKASRPQEPLPRASIEPPSLPEESLTNTTLVYRLYKTLVLHLLKLDINIPMSSIFP